MSRRPSKRVNHLPENAFDRPKHQCAKLGLEDGKTVFVKVLLPVDKRKQFTKNILDLIPLLRNDELKDAADGIYTWIDSDTGFYANRVLSSLELGTIHHSLALRSFSNEVFGAGELRKTGDSVQYNIQSGSYMKDFIVENASRIGGIVTHMNTLFQSFGLRPEFIDTPFIDIASMPLTRTELDIYVVAGYEVWFFDTEDECTLYGKAYELQETIHGDEEAIAVYSSMGHERVKSYVEMLRKRVAENKEILVRLEKVDLRGMRYGGAVAGGTAVTAVTVVASGNTSKARKAKKRQTRRRSTQSI